MGKVDVRETLEGFSVMVDGENTAFFFSFAVNSGGNSDGAHAGGGGVDGAAAGCGCGEFLFFYWEGFLRRRFMQRGFAASGSISYGYGWSDFVDGDCPALLHLAGGVEDLVLFEGLRGFEG